MMMIVVVVIPLGELVSDVTMKGGRAELTYWEPARRSAAEAADMMAPSSCGVEWAGCQVWGSEGEMRAPMV